MTQDEIIAMAKEAGWTGIYTQWAEPTGKPDWTPFKYSLTVPVTMEQIQRFAALVAAKAASRATEACAVLALDKAGTTDYDYSTCINLADAFRARGTKEGA